MYEHDRENEPNTTAALSEEERRRRRKVLLMKLGVMVLFFFIVFAFATAAWFSMNKDVTAGGMGVALTTSDFEIRVSGTNTGALSYTQSGVGQAAQYASEEIYGLSSDGTYLKGLLNGSSVIENTYDTDDSNQIIKWRLSQAYDTAEDKGLGPDSQGALTFQVVPKRSGELNPNFSLRLEGYVAADQKKNEDGSYQVIQNKITPITGESDAELQQGVNYLNGHMLFFKNRTNIGTEQNPIYAYSGLLDKDSIELKDIVDPALLTNGMLSVTANSPITATIYWIWPNTFGQMVFAANENGQRTPVGATDAARTEIQNYILANPLDVFEESVFGFAAGTSDAAKEAAIRNMMATSSGTGDEITYTFSTAAVSTGSNLDTLTLGYNSADQKIGTKVNYVLLALSLKQ